MNRWRLFLLLYFCVSAITFWLYLPESYMADKSMWADQIEFVDRRDPRALDFKKAYGHPGTTIIELGSTFHSVFGLSYRLSLYATLSLLTAACSTFIIVFVRHLRPTLRWWQYVVLVLFFNRLYYASPPSMVALPAVVLVVLFTWYVVERRLTNWRWAVAWGCMTAFSAATRVDSTALFAFIGLILCTQRLGWRWTATAMVTAGITFVALDPFFWYMPLQHAHDLVTKFTMHYSNFPDRGTLFNAGIRDFYFFAVLSIVLSIRLFMTKRFDVVPRSVLILLYTATAFTTYIISTASYHVVRYFQPLMFLWDVLLPLFTLTLLQEFLDRERAHYGETRISQRMVRLFIAAFIVAWVFPNIFLLF